MAKLAKQRFVNTHFWDDSFIRTLDMSGKLLFIYFLTNPLTNIAGAYEVSLERICFDTGMSRKTVEKNLQIFENSDKIIYREGWILLKNFIKNQKLNPSIIEGIKALVNGCPDWIKDSLSQAVPNVFYIDRNRNRNRDRKIGKDADASRQSAKSRGTKKPRESKKTPESHAAYLERKQAEFPLIDVAALYEKFYDRCKEENSRPVRPRFESWLEREEPPMEAPPTAESYEYVDPYSGGMLV